MKTSLATVILVLTLTLIHTTTHAERSKPTLKDVERFRNGLFCRSLDFQLYVEAKLPKLLLFKMNSLFKLNTISMQFHEISPVSVANYCTTVTVPIKCVMKCCTLYNKRQSEVEDQNGKSGQIRFINVNLDYHYAYHNHLSLGMRVRRSWHRIFLKSSKEAGC